ncbi:predicted GPI-anchored protein 58 [Drosophila subpulchrella]|uniref:predicted GPI-anchored protein 58 n=1 Tax=Drosophila subpulchrella TaxID=1486046 RepID=UPI0018A1ACED|nr:predicted GPI-anchored protein 58 [Drosophila subpulchrella]
MAAKAIRPRSGLQPGVVQRHERRHAGSKDHVASHEAVKRIPRPEQRPQSGPAAPSRALSSAPTRSTHSAATAPSAASPAPPAALSAAQTQQRPAPCISTHVAIRCPQSTTSSANNSAGHVTSHTTNQEHATSGPAPSAAFSAHRAASFAPPAAPTECLPSAHRTPPAAPTAAPTAAPISSPQPRPQQRQPRRIRGHPPRYERHQERPTISTAAHQPHSPSANGSASRNHIGQPVPHVSSTCRAPSAQSRH